MVSCKKHLAPIRFSIISNLLVGYVIFSCRGTKRLWRLVNRLTNKRMFGMLLWCAALNANYKRSINPWYLMFQDCLHKRRYIRTNYLLCIFPNTHGYSPAMCFFHRNWEDFPTLTWKGEGCFGVNNNDLLRRRVSEDNVVFVTSTFFDKAQWWRSHYKDIEDSYSCIVFFFFFFVW